MTDIHALRTPDASDRLTDRQLWIGGSLLAWGLYSVVILSSYRGGLAASMVGGLINVLPISLLALAVRALLRPEVMRLPLGLQAAVHGAAALTFAMLWHGAVVVLRALAAGLQGHGFAIAGFWRGAYEWQIFQGLALYAAVAAVCYALQSREATRHAERLAGGPARPPLTRYLIRRGEAMTPVDVGDIVSISGAQDYAEVATLKGRHLVRLSLGEFEARLDAEAFVRVHRSTIIHLVHLERTEPAGGGRLSAHMANGDVVPVSRAGAQALRRFMV